MACYNVAVLKPVCYKFVALTLVGCKVVVLTLVRYKFVVLTPALQWDCEWGYFSEPRAQRPCSVDGCRQTVGHSGYTKDHLPAERENPELDKNEEARVASFAARIAFSSFVMRSVCK